MSCPSPFALIEGQLLQKGGIPVDATPLQIQMFHEFTIRQTGTQCAVSGRSHKLYLLLAYLIWERKRPIPSEELTSLLWEETAPASFNALKALVHRARTCLDQLSEGAGRTLLLSREGCYQWNPDFPIRLDAEEFLKLCQSGRRARRLQALSLYRGSFLPSLEGHPWAAPTAERLHQLYLTTLLKVLPQLAEEERWQEVAQLAGCAFGLEPFREDLCRWDMEALLHLNRRREAARSYEGLQERLLTRMGVLPSDQLRELYRQSQRSRDPRAVSPVTLLERLQEPPHPGALICEYDFFRIVCHSMARMAGRSGEPLHIALISITGPEDAPLPRYSLDRAMDNLQGVILSRLRRGDAAARCSASQFVLLLPQASYENGQMICSRILRAFARQFPHSPARLQISVQPLLSSG